MRGSGANLRFLGGLLVLLAALGVVHAARACLAHSLYFRVKFGSDRDGDTRAILRRSEMSYRLYPYNYLLCIWAAEKAWNDRADVEGQDIPVYIQAAERWCGRGLALNEHKSNLRLLKTRLLSRESLPEAISYWEDYVDWQFWEPYNHAVMVELYADAGNFGKAMESLQWTKVSPSHYSQARTYLDGAWQEEMRSPPRLQQSEGDGIDFQF